MQSIGDTLASWLGTTSPRPMMTILRVVMIVALAIVAERIVTRFRGLFRKRITTNRAGHADIKPVETPRSRVPLCGFGGDIADRWYARVERGRHIDSAHPWRRRFRARQLEQWSVRPGFLR